MAMIYEILDSICFCYVILQDSSNAIFFRRKNGWERNFDILIKFICTSQMCLWSINTMILCL